MSCHVNINNCLGVVINGNTARLGRNDSNYGGVYSPDYSFVIENCNECIIKDNTLSNACLVNNFLLKGDNSSCIIKDNVGTIKSK